MADQAEKENNSDSDDGHPHAAAAPRAAAAAATTSLVASRQKTYPEVDKIVDPDLLNNGDSSSDESTTDAQDERVGKGGDGEEKITNPSSYDVLFGRGKPYQEHEGNRRLHQCVEYFRPAYSSSRRREKMVIAQNIVRFVKDSTKHPGRFLRRIEGGDYWCEVPDSVAREKVSHALRARQRAHASPSFSSNSTSNAAAPSSKGSDPKPITEVACSSKDPGSPMPNAVPLSSSTGVNPRVSSTTLPQQQSVLSSPSFTGEVGEMSGSLGGTRDVSSIAHLLFGGGLLPPGAPGQFPVPAPAYQNPYLDLFSSMAPSNPLASLQVPGGPLPPSLLSALTEQNIHHLGMGGLQMGAPSVGGMDPFLLEAMLQLRQQRDHQQYDDNNAGGDMDGSARMDRNNLR